MSDLTQMTLAQLVTLHNKHTAKPVKKFASKADAIRRTRAVLAAEKSGPTYNLLAWKPVAALRDGTCRAKALELISRKGGASLSELQQQCGFKDRLNTIQGVRLLNYKQGIALRGNEACIELA